MKHSVSMNRRDVVWHASVLVLVALISFYIGHRAPTFHSSAPVLSNIFPITRQRSATVVFNTDVATRGYVHFSKTTPVPEFGYIGGLYERPLHAIDLPDLTPNTTYYYYVTATDDAGRTSTSETMAFKTAPATASTSVQ